MNEADVLKALKDPDTKVTLEEAKNMLAVLKQSVVDYDEALSEKIIGSHSFYEGEYNMLRITERLLDKLVLKEKE